MQGRRPSRRRPRLCRGGPAQPLENLADLLPRNYFFSSLAAYFFRNRSTRPAVSMIFCLPVMKG